MGDTDLTLDEVIEFGSERSEQDADAFEGDIPEHADSLLVSRATAVLETLSNVRAARGSTEMDDPADEEVADALSEDLVDVLLAMGALDYEYDLHVAEAFEEYIELAEAYDDLQDALADAETRDEKVEAIDEHMTEEMREAAGMGADGVTAGTNVDGDEYEPTDPDKSFQ